MRLISTVVASLILHAFLLLVPVGTSPFNPADQILIGGSQKSAQLLIALIPMSSVAEDVLSTAPEIPNEANEHTTTEILPAEAAQNQQHSTTEKSSASDGIEQITDAPPRYYARHELDRPPRMADDLSENEGALDRALRNVDEHGFVVFELWISNKGVVEKSAIVSTDLSETVVGIVRSNVDLARFIPARLNKQAVHSRITIEFLVKEKSRN